MFGTAEQQPAPPPTPPGSRRGEVESKLALVRRRLDERSLDAAVLSRADAVAWVTAGVTNRIESGSPESLLWIVVTRSGALALTTNVERPRLAAEASLGELGLELYDVPWYDANGFARTASELAGVPLPRIGGLGVDIADDLVELRLALQPAEQERLAALAAEVADVLESALGSWRPGERDLDVQARVAEGLERAGAFAACLIVGGDERVEQFRHPLAAGAPMYRLVMAVVVAERGGLHAAATRFASAGSLPAPLAQARLAALSVESEVLGACTPGTPYGEALLALARGYTTAGHPDGWRDHYQGGPIGYRQREFEIAPTQTSSRWFRTPVAAGHAVAWNPSVPGGGKSEDTYLVETDGLRRLTATTTWPEAYQRPAVLDITTGNAA